MRRLAVLRLQSMVTAFLAAVSAGCATGPALVTPEPPSPGRAVIYVYRANSLPGAGVKPELWIGARPIGAMVNGSYVRAEVLPITTLVSSPDCRPVGVDAALRPGATTFFQLELTNKSFELAGRHYFDYGCRIVQRSEAEALDQMRGLRLANSQR
jgi:hypothetical protein